MAQITHKKYRTFNFFKKSITNKNLMFSIENRMVSISSVKVPYILDEWCRFYENRQRQHPRFKSSLIKKSEYVQISKNII